MSTEHHSLLQKLQASEAFSRVLLESSPDCIKLLDLDGNLLSMNETGQRLMEIDNFASFSGRCWLDFWPQHALVEQAVDAAKAGGEGRFQGFSQTAKGTPKWWDVRVIRVSPPDSLQDILLSVSRDMTEQKRAEQRLAIDHAVAQALLEASNLDAAAPAIVDVFCQQLNLEIGEFWLLDQTQDQIMCIARHMTQELEQSDAGQTFRQAQSFARNIGLPGAAWQRKAPVWMQDMADDPNLWPNFWQSATLAAMKLHMGLAFPILHEDEFIGVITFFARHPFVPEQTLLSMMAILGREIGQFVQAKRTEAALRQSEASYRALFEQAGVGKAEFDAKSLRFLRVNHRLCEITGYSPDELLALSYEQLLHPDEMADFKEARTRITGASPDIYVVERRYCRKDGTTGWLELNFSPIATNQQEMVRSVGTIRDVTERKQAEQTIRFQARLLDAVEQAVIAIDRNGQIIYWNRFAEQLYGWKASETLGQNISAIISSGTAREQATEIMAALLQGKSWTGEFWVRRRDGTIFPAYVIDSPLYDEQNQLVGIVGVSIDISERKAAAEAVRANAERFQNLANAIPQIVWVNNSAGEQEYLNERWLEYTGLSYEVSLADSGQAIHPADRSQAFALWQEAYAQGAPYTHEMRLRRADGVYRWHLMRTVPVRNTEGKIINWYGTATDIDDRKRAELNQQFLANLTHQLRMLLDPEEMRETVVSALGRYLNVERCGLHEVDVTNDRVIIHGSWRKQAVPDQSGTYPLSSFVTAALQQTISEGQSTTVSDAFTDPRTTTAWESYQRLGVRAFAFTPYLEKGRWVALLGVDCAEPRVWQVDEVELLEEITNRFWPLIEKARAEQALRASAIQLRLITDATPGLISYVDAEQRYRFVNAAYESWFGLTRDQIIGSQIRDLLGTETYPQIEPYIQAALAGQQVTFQQIYPRHDGAQRTAMVTYVPQFEQDENEPTAAGNVPPTQVAGFHILLTDITELKETEAALRASEELSRRQLAELQAVYATAPIGLAVLDCDLRYVRLNERLAEINGRPIKEHWGRTVREIVPALADIAEPHLRHVIATGEPVLGLEINGETAAQPGVERSWLESCYPLATANGQVLGVNVVIQDITERKRYERELQQINETLELRVAERTRELTQRYEELDRFAYVASHDLKAPLRAIEHLATWISEDADELLPAKSKAHLDKMRSRIKRMEGLLDDLLAYSRADRYTSKPEKVDTGQLVDEVIKLFALPEGFAITAQPAMPVAVTERVPLELILRNLLSNAIKHHNRRDGHVQVTARDLGKTIEFAVSDDGPGIDPQFHERIFQMFQTLQPRDKVEGSGIGLAVVKKVLESRGGKINVESAEGQGATFKFIWPK